MSSEKTVAPYGTWTSPITSDITSGGIVSFNQLHVNPKTGQIYLIEGRPAEKGRCAIVEVTITGESIEILPKKYSARSKVHEYGGGAAILGPDGKFVFTDAYTDGVFLLSPTGEVEEVIAGDPNTRFADFHVSPTEPHWVIAVQESHSQDGDVLNTIVAINTRTKASKVVISGADFYSHPRFSPGGNRICWMQWVNPDMPWTGSQVYVAHWRDGKVDNQKYIAGKAKKESVCQPRWHIDGTLLFANEPTGFWQLYRFDTNTEKVEYVQLKGYEDAEIGAREIKLGNSTYVSLGKDKLVIAYIRNGANGVLLYDILKKEIVELPLGFVEVALCGLRRVSDTQFAIIGATTKSSRALYLVDIKKPGGKLLLKHSAHIDLPASVFSEPQQISFPRTQGTDRSSSSHAVFIPPNNPNYESSPGTKPPLIVSIHGGPTSHVPPSLTLESQYFTSRGYAYCYVNYAGSTGYGRAYRDELEYSWGIKDVGDTVSCIEYLDAQGLIDGKKGGSAGGYTVLQGLIMYPAVFTAGCVLYGVTDLKMLAKDTHKFEGHYLFALLFPEDTAEEIKEKIYYDRSPVNHVDKITRPVTLLQGTDDMVVPIAQALEMEKAMKKNGVDVQLVVFEGEGHGWKMKENMKRSIEVEEDMWRKNLL
ncbi:Acylamino-acid-releasing enzyme [Lachnellula occidentalis]|uniref:Acylamino-acid-releasing enzyme n=1 Tax=Lachnellula occidentalis TaxID=215460 RepID=A0A8H8U993_9HELO|nr:Acylamino-acid-releasing enzyme [Lachnellula occidentalis]